MWVIQQVGTNVFPVAPLLFCFYICLISPSQRVSRASATSLALVPACLFLWETFNLIFAATKLTRNRYEQPGKCMSSSNKTINENVWFSLYPVFVCVLNQGKCLLSVPLLIWNMMTYWKLLSKLSFALKLFFLTRAKALPYFINKKKEFTEGTK
jgi:hypothetical protein